MAGNMARLRRWMGALQQGTALPAHPSDATVDSALASGIIWLRWAQLPALDSDPTPESLLVYEALELLALCALVDYDNWLRIVTEIWPKEMAFWADAFYPDKFELGVEVHANARGQLSKWAQRAWLVDPAIARSTSSNYAFVRDEYEAALRRRSVVLDPFKVIRVKIVLDDLAPDQAGEYSLLLFEIVQLARTQAGRKARVVVPRRWSPLFWLFRVNTDRSDLTVSDILLIEEITSCGVCVPALSFFSVETMSKDLTVHKVACLQRMIVAPKRTACVPVETITIDLHAARKTLDSVFASVFYSKTVRQLCVEKNAAVDQGGRERLMYWLALCVFGRYGCPSLDVLRLDASELQMRDIQILGRTLHEDDAFIRLFPEAAGMTEDECMVPKAAQISLTRSLGSRETPSHLPINLSLPVQALRTIAVDNRMVSLLLPGWGQAWVHHSDVALNRASEGARALFPKMPAIWYLALECANEPVVIELLGLVGGRLRSLELDWTDGDQPFSVDGIRAVCVACPNLDIINLTGISIESLDVLAQCYADNTCRSGRLVLLVEHVSLQATKPPKFFDLLADEDHLMSQHIREIYLSFYTPQLTNQLRQLLSTAAEMLKHNKHLRNLDIRIEFHDEATRLAAQNSIGVIEGLFASLNRPSVAIRVAPLCIKAKLAFLSILRESHDEPRLSARSSFDARVIGLVFEFAAECKKRRVQVFTE